MAGETGVSELECARRLVKRSIYQTGATLSRLKHTLAVVEAAIEAHDVQRAMNKKYDQLEESLKSTMSALR